MIGGLGIMKVQEINAALLEKLGQKILPNAIILELNCDN